MVTNVSEVKPVRFGGHLNPQFYFQPPIGGRLNTHSVLRVLPVAVSTRHSWLWQMWDDVYTRNCFSESEGTCFGAPGQKPLPSMNEFTILWIFPYGWPIPLTFQPQICKEGYIHCLWCLSGMLSVRPGAGPIIGRCFGACNGTCTCTCTCTSCVEERRPQLKN